MTNTPPELSLNPYLNVKGASDAITFYCEAFGAEEVFRLDEPNDDRVAHAELRFGDTRMMISDEYPDFGALGPNEFGGSPVKLHLTVENVDEVFARAIDHGAMELRKVKDQFHGGRNGVLTDPYGHVWIIETDEKLVTPDEMQRRWNEIGTA